MDKLFGIDVSLYQKGFDFTRAKGEGVKFAIIKASEGQFTDPVFESAYKAAKAAGVHVGAYHYLTASDSASAVAEADYFIRAVSGKAFEYPLFVDVEGASMKAVGKEKLTGIVRAFCERVEKAGYWCGFYTNLDFYRNYLDGEALAKRFSLWLAAWVKEKPVDCQVWQFGGETNIIRTNKVAGVVCDQSYSYKDFPALIKAKGLNGLARPAASKPAAPSAPAAYAPKVGDKVRLKAGAKIWKTSDVFASWVYSSDLWVREVSGERVVISTVKSGAVTGAVSAGDLIKV